MKINVVIIKNWLFIKILNNLMRNDGEQAYIDNIIIVINNFLRSFLRLLF